MTKINLVAERNPMRRVARFALQLAFASALVWCSVTPALARLTCIAANVTLNYGPYDVLAGTVLDATGAITVTCTKSGTNANVNGNVTYEVALTPLPPRQLAAPSGGERLNHQLYLDAARTAKPWGDGTGGTFVITSTFFVGRNSTASDVSDNFYGRIPGGQDVSAASPGPPPTTYTQIFTVTVRCTSPARTC